MHEKEAQHDSMIEMQTQFKQMSQDMSAIHTQINTYTSMTVEVATLKAKLDNAERVADAQNKRIQDLEAMRRLR